MTHPNDLMFKNATQIAEGRIRAARALQSREVAHVVRLTLAWLVSRVKARKIATVCRQ